MRIQRVSMSSSSFIHRTRGRFGFTLVELLVVIGIIAVLIGMLLPALNRAKQHAMSVQCMANLRSCGQALFLYANQNKNFLPMMALQEPQNLPLGNFIAETG